MDSGWEAEPRTESGSLETPTNGCAGHDVPWGSPHQQARGGKRIVVSRRSPMEGGISARATSATLPLHGRSRKKLLLVARAPRSIAGWTTTKRWGEGRQ